MRIDSFRSVIFKNDRQFKKKFSRVALVLFVALSALFFAFSSMKHRSQKLHRVEKMDERDEIVEKFFQQREKIILGNLGNYLFRNYSYPRKESKNFKILIWKDGTFLERRHIKFFSAERHNPFEDCSVNNCILSYESSDIESADAVVVLLHRLKNATDLPNVKKRPHTQRWIFLTDESPWHTFLNRNNKWSDYSGIFNWSMSYKMQSDVPVPYGRTVPLTKKRAINGNSPEAIAELVPYADDKRRDVLVAAMISNCNNRNERMGYVRELGKFMTVDLYGECGNELKKECSGHFGNDCSKLNRYLFFLAFENSNCDQYATEKLFWNAYSKGAVPVIMGPDPKICKILLPPNSYLHIKDYARPSDLARHLQLLNATFDKQFYRLHQWRRHFSVENEHGYFGSKSIHYCRVCEALNYNDETPKIYANLSFYLNPDDNCT